jgi:RHS repeat-associated protein
MLAKLRKSLYVFLMLLPCLPLQAGRVTYIYTDPQGTPLAEADVAGNVTSVFDYGPYGTRALGEAFDGPGFTGHMSDTDTNLDYMQARYYDPGLGRFLSADPVALKAGDSFALNRYDYVNNNPLIHTDPSGKCIEDLCIGEAIIACAATPCGPAVAATGAAIISVLTVNAVQTTAAQLSHHNEEVPPAPPVSKVGDAPAPASDSNTNPYAGAVDVPVVVVDKNGNAIPVPADHKVTSSPNGDYQQVRDRDGRATGARLDRGGHKTQSDTRAQDPHAHQPGQTTEDGNPHLPINSGGG